MAHHRTLPEKTTPMCTLKNFPQPDRAHTAGMNKLCGTEDRDFFGIRPCDELQWSPSKADSKKIVHYRDGVLWSGA